MKPTNTIGFGSGVPPQWPEEAMIYHPPPGTVPTVTVAPRIESTQPARPGVVEQPAAGEKRNRIEERNSRQSL